MDKLLEKINNVVPFNETEAKHIEEAKKLLTALPESCFISDHKDASNHFTGSAFVVNSKFDKVCLLHHKKIERWMQPGGHIIPEDSNDTLMTATREVKEEFGLESLIIPSEQIFDIDVHMIVAHKGRPDHFHYDIRYLFIADDSEEFKPKEGESQNIKWVELEKACELGVDISVLRMVDKVRILRDKRNAA